MKKLWAVLLALTLTISAAPAVFAASLEIPAVSYDVVVDVKLNNDAQVAVMHMKLDVMPDRIELMDTAFELDVNTANNNIILYSEVKKNPIKSGVIFKLHYDGITDNTAFTLTTIDATNTEASAKVTIPPVQGEIKIYYTTVEITATKDDIIGKGDDGIDVDNNGVVDTIDLEKVVNGQK